MDAILFKQAATQAERAGYFALRRAIFVEEQGMFHGSDVDEYDSDPATLQLVAVCAASGEVVGAVRCYSAGDDVWYGGRLAVSAEYRRHPAAIGPNLCRLAEASVIERGSRRFLAYIQMQNVRFFDRLGWSTVGEPADYHGQLHQLMAASLTVTVFEPIGAGARQTAHV
jgi:putative N-acetyltransferase (TIGR04045 family)